MFDEPSSYLDVKQRLNAAVTIRSLLRADRYAIFMELNYWYFTKYDDIQLRIFIFFCFRYIIVVEHDLSVLDYLSDFICCLYGSPGAYGVVTLPFSVKEGHN